MNNKPVIAQKSPYPIQVEEGKSYYWCQCGQSKKQPFCDGSHKRTSFSPVVYKAKETKKYIFVDVNIHLTSHFVMVRISVYK